ncbi:Ethanolaminephosphotransferase 1 [Eumeta japonica]|uniref:Ethanolaminephosphotransferase 1 n=1 Tax=Eumeta variegata TaxID=151549 RepID=A0A4C1YU34_EUMVA|nr:Ethanolaminephosphotransferase 1 [Eumeta japonica]
MCKAAAALSAVQCSSSDMLCMDMLHILPMLLDGIDGKQARRTGTSGPLGELFDHGLDSYSVVLIPTCVYSLFSSDLSRLRFFLLLWNIFINFYLTHWEKYNTGVMFLPWGYDFTMLCRLIVAQMSDTRCEVFNSLIVPYALTMIITFLTPPSVIVETTLLLFLCIASCIAHVHYGTKVVS